MTREEIGILVQTIKNAAHAVNLLVEATREHPTEEWEQVFGEAFDAMDALAYELAGRPLTD